MRNPAGYLSNTERTVCALFGTALSILALRRGSAAARSVTGVLAAGLLVRAVTGQHVIPTLQPRRSGHRAYSDAVDTSVDDSFPASDPPASRIPDEPPVNAQAKWDAHRARQANGGFPGD